MRTSSPPPTTAPPREKTVSGRKKTFRFWRKVFFLLQYRSTQPEMRRVGTVKASRKRAIWAPVREDQAPMKVS